MERMSCPRSSHTVAASSACAASSRIVAIALHFRYVWNCEERKQHLQNICITSLSPRSPIQATEQRKHHSKQQTLSAHSLAYTSHGASAAAAATAPLLSHSFAKYLPSSPLAQIVKEKRRKVVKMNVLSWHNYPWYVVYRIAVIPSVLLARALLLFIYTYTRTVVPTDRFLR